MANFKVDDYVQVNERIEKFYEKYPEGSIQTQIEKLDEGMVIIKAYAYKSPNDSKPCTGHAYEVEGSSFINKTSYIENCETSAVGRALAMMGFEIKKSIASREEVENAKLQQSKFEEAIDEVKVDALTRAIERAKFSEEDVNNILQPLGYSNIKAIKQKDYSKVVSAFQKINKKGE